MPEFSNPFPGNVPRQMTQHELERALMLDIAAEYEAVHLYLSQMDATDNEDARAVLFDIAAEELVHVGEFTSLLYRLNPLVGAKAREGFDEVQALLANKSPYPAAMAAEDADGAQPMPRKLTVGSLKEA